MILQFRLLLSLLVFSLTCFFGIQGLMHRRECRTAIYRALDDYRAILDETYNGTYNGTNNGTYHGTYHGTHNGTYNETEVWGHIDTRCFATSVFRPRIRLLTLEESIMFMKLAETTNGMRNVVRRAISLPEMLPVLQIVTTESSVSTEILGYLGEMHLRMSGLHLATSAAIDEIGLAAAYLPRTIIPKLSKEAFDRILEKINLNTDLMLGMSGVGDAANVSTIQLPFTTNHLAINVQLFKAICANVFRFYYSFESFEEFRKTVHFWQCARKIVCNRAPPEWVQQNSFAIGSNVWACGPLGEGHRKKFIISTRKKYTANNHCGRTLAKKMITGGENATDVTTEEGLLQLGNLFLCLDTTSLRRAVRALNCSLIAEALAQNLFPHSVLRIGNRKCSTLPEDPSDVTCNDFDELGGFIKEVPLTFIKKVPSIPLCEQQCVSVITQRCRKAIKRYVTSRCFKDSKLDSASLVSMGPLIMELPLAKFKEIKADDIMNINMEELKTNIKEKMKTDTRKGALLGMLADKVTETGNLQVIADNEVMMKGLSIQKLNQTVSNVDENLGLNKVGFVPVLSDAQNKFFMGKMLDREKIEDLSEKDLRVKKSIVKGLLSSQIKDLDIEEGMDFAATICEQTNWPPKTRRAISRNLLFGNLELIDKQNPMLHLTEDVVQRIGCECLLGLSPEEIGSSAITTCLALCSAIGKCEYTRCIDPYHRRNLTRTCLECLGKAGANTSLTEEDVDLLGFGLAAELTVEELTNKIPDYVLQSKLSMLAHACMRKDYREALADRMKAINVLGNASQTLEELSQLLIFLPDVEVQKIDSIMLTDLVPTILSQLFPETREGEQVTYCCEKWLEEIDPEDLADLKAKRKIFIGHLLNAWKATHGARRKRSVGHWLCADMEWNGETFTSASLSDLQNIQVDEFNNCLGFFGELGTWSKDQLSVLLSKVASDIGDICQLTTDDYLSMGNIVLAMTTDNINCLPLNNTDIVTSLGMQHEWTEMQLSSLASRYLEVRSQSDLSNLNSLDIPILGHILCGFTPQQIQSIPLSIFRESGAHIGQMKTCPYEQLQAIKSMIAHETAYGPVSSWQPYTISELGIITASLTGEEIMMLDSESIESIPTHVIALIPPHALQNLTIEQINAMSDLQAMEVTSTQRLAMNPEQESTLIQVIFNGYFDQLLLVNRPTTTIPPSTSTSNSSTTTFTSTLTPTTLPTAGPEETAVGLIAGLTISGVVSLIGIFAVVKYWIRPCLVRVQPVVYEDIAMVAEHTE